ncbi:MAG: hypothetical protein AAFQ35_12250, partial [Pseudomonadota bacterium]
SYLPTQDVVAITRGVSDGAKLRSVAVDAERTIYVTLERDGVAFLERFDRDALFDGSLRFELEAPQTSVTLPSWRNGQELAVWADGVYVGTHRVLGNALTLPQPASIIECGFDFKVDVVLPPIREQLPSNAKFRAPGRIFKAEMSLYQSGGFAIDANDGDAHPVTVRAFAEALDTSIDDARLTGNIEVANLAGFTDRPRLRLYQPEPGPLTVRSVRLEVAYPS